VDNWNYWFFCI